MEYRRFVAFNVVGWLLWGVGVSLAGFWLGRSIPSIDTYLLPIIVAIIVVSLIPAAVEALRARRRSRT
jgi:membrane-associated protein